jgi:two-component system response regulator PhoP
MDHPFPTFPTLAVIEDDEDLRANLLLTLRSKKFPAWGAASAEEFYRERAVLPADIVLIDLGLPGEDGLTALRHLRQNSNLGIIVVTARGGTEHRIAGLEAGADHYFVKPVDPRELLAAIDTLWRRVGGKPISISPRAGDEEPGRIWVLSRADGCLKLPDGRKLPLSQREYEYLACLMDNPGTLFTKDALHQHLFPDLVEIDPHRVEVILSRLRQKAESQLGLTLPIRTVFGKGFAFVGATQIDTATSSSQ